MQKHDNPYMVMIMVLKKKKFVSDIYMMHFLEWVTTYSCIARQHGLCLTAAPRL